MLGIVAILVVIACLSVSFGFNHKAIIPKNAFSAYTKILPTQESHKLVTLPRVMRAGATRMSMVEEPAAETTQQKVDFSQYTVGQEYEGKAVAAKQFGVFVDISTGTNVLLPRSLLSRGSYEKLKKQAETKSSDLVKVELVSVSAENQTLSGKYLSDNFKERPDLSTLAGKDLAGKFFNATVISAHDFGVFAEIEEYGIEGLVPASRMESSGGSIQKSYPSGTTVQVQISEVNVGEKKLVLSMTKGRSDVSAFEGFPHDQWLQGVVQSVSSFGLFVRPAGYEMTGLVHFTRIPRDLVAVLKKRVPIEAGTNKTDVEALFQEGDVVKMRVHQVKVAARRLELSMLPYRANEDDDDDYVVEGRDPEGEEFNNRFDNSDDEDGSYDSEDTLLWWRGETYTKSAFLPDTSLDEEVAVLNESKDIVEGTWRRMFEIDMREDQADFSSKAVDNDLKELAEEIGELDGLDDELLEADRFATSDASSKARFGSFVSTSVLPAGWKDEIDFFQQLDTAETEISTRLRGGKVKEQADFEELLKEVEQELEQAAARAPKAAPVADPVIAAAAEAEAAEEAAEAAATTTTETTTAEEAEEPAAEEPAAAAPEEPVA